MHEVGAFEAKNRFGALLGRVDRIEEARAALSHLIRAHPGLTIARYRVFWSRVFSPELMTIVLNWLRKAGLPEE